MRIGLNLLYARSRIGGAWTYIANIIRAISQEDDVNTYVAFVHQESVSLVPKIQNFEAVRMNALGKCSRVLGEHFLLPFLARKYKLDVLHWFGNVQSPIQTTRSVITVHDMKPFELGDVDYWSSRSRYMRCVMPVSLRRADMILPVSDWTAQRLCALLSLPRAKMRVVPNPLDLDFVAPGPEAVESFRLKYGLPKEFWLYVSHYYPHKNHARLLQAYAKLTMSECSNWPLVFCGRTNGAEANLRRMANDLNVLTRVRWLPWVPDEEMTALYAAAGAMVFPSLYEGGGIPVMEARACGCAVAASHLPTVLEYGDEAVVLFDPKSIDSIAEAMLEIQANRSKFQARRTSTTKYSRDLRPTTIARRLIRAYVEAVRGPRGAMDQLAGV